MWLLIFCLSAGGIGCGDVAVAQYAEKSQCESAGLAIIGKSNVIAYCEEKEKYLKTPCARGERPPIFGDWCNYVTIPQRFLNQ